MIRFSDAIILATTKLRARRMRLGISVFIASLLFGVLFAASLVAQGVFRSVEKFSSEAFGSRYIVQSNTLAGGLSDTSSPDLIARAQELQKQMTAKKKAEAKRLGIEYDEKSERPPFTEFDVPGGKQKDVDINTEAGRQAMLEFSVKNPAPGMDALKKLADDYRPVAYYKQTPLPTLLGDSRSLQVLKDGQEKYDSKPDQGGFTQTGLASFSQSWALMSDELLDPFLLPGASVKQSEDGSLPVVAPYTAVEQLLNLKSLPSNATPDQKLARLKEVRARAKSVTFEVCYRNGTSAERVSTAISNQEDLLRNKDKKDYVKQSLIYGLPKSPCTDVVIASDTRTSAEKALALKQEEFDRIFGKAPAEQQILRFHVVGIAPDPLGGAGFGVSDVLRMFVASSLGQSSWLTPSSAKDISPAISKLFPENAISLGQPPSYFVELPDAITAKKFISEKECRLDYSVAPGPVAPDNPMEKCQKEGKPFMLVPFGSNSLALDTVKRGFHRVFYIAAAVVAGIATIILMGLLGRMIADSRRETAVFRAIGAKRVDIVQIYLLYVFACIAMICVVSGIIGFGLSQYAVGRQQESLTVQALTIFSSHDLSQVFKLRYFYLPDALQLVGVAFGAGLLSSLIPLIRNVRRNPIKDMRDDT